MTNTDRKRMAMYKLTLTPLSNIHRLSDFAPKNYREISLEGIYYCMEAIRQELGHFIRDVHALGEWE
ncbi:MAG: hypothetical protein LBI19_03225 [Oscillospiraceae bacterium]|jgi:hypothetical protein|nr:hypothetical protein [Oscillospiraceae bacterium]